MRKGFCSLLLFFSSILVSAQINRNQIFDADSIELKNRYLKINALSFLDIGLPTFQIGLEHRINKRKSFELTAGLPLKIKKQLRNTDSTYVHFYKIKSEYKFFSSKKSLHYSSIEAFYTRSAFSDFYAFFIRGRIEYAAEYAEFKKSIWGIAFKKGTFLKSKKTGKINGDCSYGLGIRFINTRILDINPAMVDHNHHLFASHRKAGWKISPHVSWAVKIPIKL